MLKKIVFVLLLLVTTISLTGCNKYSEEAGVYELTSITGDVTKSMFKYYTIDLNANGTFEIDAAYTTTTQLYNAKGTYDIEDGKINLYTKSGGQTITETYDYDGETIKMKVSTAGMSFNATFTKVVE